MKAKEKAEEFLWKYLPILDGWTDNSKTELAKKCAIITVDEIISCIRIINKIEGKRMDSAAIKFYEGVKQELEKM